MDWITNHKNIFLLLNILFDILLNGITFIHPITTKLISAEDGENFNLCEYRNEFETILIISYKSLVIIIMLLLIFVEWNIKETLYDMRFLVSALYIDILSIILTIVFKFIVIKNYISYFIIQIIIASIISISNYTFLYGIRALLGFMSKQNVKLQFINNINEKFINSEAQTHEVVQTYDSSTNNINTVVDYIENDENDETGENIEKSFISRMLEYHYSTEVLNTKFQKTTFIK